MNTPLNVCMLLLILTAVVGVLATAQSPELLEQIGRKLRARSRALIASRSAWEFAYAQSLQSDHETLPNPLKAAQSAWPRSKP